MTKYRTCRICKCRINISKQNHSYGIIGRVKHFFCWECSGVKADEYLDNGGE